MGNDTQLQDNDYKYCMQDTGAIYIGARYSYLEIMQNEMINFKVKSIIEHYLAKDTDLETSVESHLYYMTKEQFSYRTYKQLKLKIKVSILTEKKTFFTHKTKVGYETKILHLEELADMNLAQKKKAGLMIQEIIISKLALMTFNV